MNTRDILLALIDDSGGPKAFAKRVGLSESMVFKTLKGDRQFGKASATKVAIAFPGQIDARELVWVEFNKSKAVA